MQPSGTTTLRRLALVLLAGRSIERRCAARRFARLERRHRLIIFGDYIRWPAVVSRVSQPRIESFLAAVVTAALSGELKRIARVNE